MRKKENTEKLGTLLNKTELTNLQGDIFNSKTLDNKVVIISFFQTWCGDCVKEQPNLLKLKEKFGDQLEVLMISDEPTDLITKFKEKFNSGLNFYHSSVKLKPDLNVTAYPTTYLFDKKGETKIMKVEGINWYTPEIITQIEQSLAQ
ncbi:MAG: TlpA disulfide reductase family protein [bacterium]|nr:TlpA disulfide reductase family protein [bacterium]